MATSTDRILAFVGRIVASLAESRAQGMVPPIERRRLGTVAIECGSKNSASFLTSLYSHVAEKGLHTEPPLNSPSLRRNDWIRFSTDRFPPEELLFPKESDLRRFVQASLGTGIFRELRLYQEGRRTLGREFRLPDGRRIDLLCEERTKSGLGGLVVLELKRRHQKGTVEQMMGYIDALRAKFPPRNVRGMIITGHEERLSAASLEGARSAQYDIAWYRYAVEFRGIHPKEPVRRLPEDRKDPS